ncbi:unnamed protein product [Pedinophyceae sp. YPF-701]|nr:unnamed protein product [Pedinophyceae sp. YPF-701]
MSTAVGLAGAPQPLHRGEPAPQLKGFDKHAALASWPVVAPSCPPAMRRAHWDPKQFSLIKQLGTGQGRTEVWLALDRPSETKVALKIVRRSRSDSVVTTHMAREAAIQTRLDHPNILRLYAAFRTDSHYFLVLEVADGQTLLAKIAHLPSFEPLLVKKVIKPLFTSLDYVHSRGIIHRDLKPENVLFGTDGNFKLADWGYAMDLAAERPVTRLGTLDFMAPEVVACGRRDCTNIQDAVECPKELTIPRAERVPYRPAADIWSAGALVFEVFARRPPFRYTRQDREPDILRRALDGSYHFPNGFSEPLKDFLALCLQVDASRRPSAAQLLQHPLIMQYERPQPKRAAAPRAVPSWGPDSTTSSQPVSPAPGVQLTGKHLSGDSGYDTNMSTDHGDANLGATQHMAPDVANNMAATQAAMAVQLPSPTPAPAPRFTSDGLYASPHQVALNRHASVNGIGSGSQTNMQRVRLTNQGQGRCSGIPDSMAGSMHGTPNRLTVGSGISDFPSMAGESKHSPWMSRKAPAALDVAADQDLRARRRTDNTGVHAQNGPEELLSNQSQSMRMLSNRQQWRATSGPTAPATPTTPAAPVAVHAQGMVPQAPPVASSGRSREVVSMKADAHEGSTHMLNGTYGLSVLDEGTADGASTGTGRSSGTRAKQRTGSGAHGPSTGVDSAGRGRLKGAFMGIFRRKTHDC